MSKLLRNWGNGRIAMLCGLTAVAAILATWPVADSPYNDDWSYAFTVKRLIETGRLTYNGWASASLIAQAYWGVAWVRAFGGFSFDALRWSTVPFSAGAVVVVYLLGRRAGLAVGSAVFGAMLLATSPLFLPIAATFMTDSPGLFCIVLSLYGSVRAMESGSRRAGVGWIVVSTMVGWLGGTSRQVVWVAPLATLPVVVWWNQANAMRLTAAFGWTVVAGGAWAAMRWFARQPFALSEPSILGDLRVGLRSPEHFGMNVAAIGLTAVLAVLPATVGVWQRDRLRLAAFIALGVVVVIACRPDKAVLPWMENTITATGVMGRAELAGDRPVVLPTVVREVVSVGVWATGCAIAAVCFSLMSGVISRRRPWDETTTPFSGGPEGTRFGATKRDPSGQPLKGKPGAMPTLIVLGVFAFAYTACLLPRAARDMAFDRYVIPLIPCLAIPLLRCWPRSRVGRGVAWGLLAVYGLFGIASTQEVTALARARTMAADRILAAGYRRPDIDAGFEFDYWTELTVDGHINDERLRNPPYTGGEPTPSVQPLFRLEFSPAVDTKPTVFPTVWYWSMLPPFRRAVITREFVNPIWRTPEWQQLHRLDRKHVLTK